MGTELHVQAGVWEHRAALFMEGEARDRWNGGGLLTDALYRVAVARGLRMTTDLDHLDPRPVRGWTVWIDEDRSITLCWPQFRPLLEHAPVELPDGWLDTATADGAVVIFAGSTLGMHDGDHHAALHLQQAAETGALASGVVRVSTTPVPLQHLVL